MTNQNQKLQISESFFQTEPLINMLKDRTSSVRLSGIRELYGDKNKNIVFHLRNLSFDHDETVQTEAKKKLNSIEMFYRKKFSYYQDMLHKAPDEPSYKFGFAVTCFRYSQIWVQNKRLNEYFLRQALKYLNQLIRMFEPRSRYFYFRAKVLRDLKKDKLAIEDYKNVLKKSRNHTGAILSLIDLYLHVKKPENSFRLIKQIQKKKLPMQIQAAFDFWIN